MPRPLIIKIDSHKSQPNKKATGSIDIQLLKGLPKERLYEAYNTQSDNSSSVVNEQEINPSEENGSRSIVRNLISRYETSPERANLIKYKSKSLVDLQKPQISMPKQKTQDDLFYNKGRYNNDEGENQKFDFKKVFLKFETSSQSVVNQIKNYKISSTNDSLDLAGIKQKASALLKQHQTEQEYSSWQDQVIELLQQIENLNFKKSSEIKSREEKTSHAIYKEEKNKPTLSESERKKNLKVGDIKKMFENGKGDNVKPLSRSVSSYATYFGVKSMDEDNIPVNRSVYNYRSFSATPFNDDYNNNNNDMGNEESEESEEDSDVIEGNRFITQPILESSMKIQELKNFFESDPEKYVTYESYIQTDQPEEIDASNLLNNLETEEVHVVENRMLPPPTMLVLNSEVDGNANVQTSKQQLEEITKDIEVYEQEIDNLSEKNKQEGGYINELLIKVLIKLDGVKTYGNAVILAERRKAIQFCTYCITKLGDKIKG